MIDLASDPTLSKLLNQFSVPMFAMDRPKPGGTFSLVCMNAALETSSGKPADDILGKTVFELLPMKEARLANARYDQCVASRGDLRFRDRFTTAGRPVCWDTTLQYVDLGEGGDRVVGTCIQIALAEIVGPQVPVLDDIQYFSSLADFQLQNLITTFETYRDGDVYSLRSEQQIDRLAGMCRTVQRAVEDIRKVVHSNRIHDMSPLASERAAQATQTARRNNAGSDTIGALFADVVEDLHKVG